MDEQQSNPTDPISEENIEQQKEQVAESAKTFFQRLWIFFKNIISLENGVDEAGTVAGILDDVEFRGHAVWILLCAILIASVGLNVGSIPIIIGAMLISPLMGPILGIGLAAGTNDWELLMKSLKNFAVAVVISIIVSALYFAIVPMPEINVELEDRKSASLLAIAVAFFGGAAGIIAGSRSFKSNVVPGVAIATALMPPLCTAGYGLGTLQWEYFVGALYLFFINSVFIALPTYLYIKYMRFPVKDFVDPAKERKIKRLIYLFIFITVVPSAFIFYNVLQKSFFERNAGNFITELEAVLEPTNTYVVGDAKVLYDKKHPVIKIALMGDPLSDELRSRFDQLKMQNSLENCVLDIREPRDYSQAIDALKEESEAQSLEMNRNMFQSMLREKDQQISSLEKQVSHLSYSQAPFPDISAEVKMLFPEIEQLAFAKLAETDFQQGIDTIPTLLIQWPKKITPKQIRNNETQLKRWLQTRLKDSEARIIRYEPDEE